MTVAALILAAGTASRYRAAGGSALSKLVAEFRGEPLVRAAARAALAAGLEVHVVTGHARAEVEAALSGLPLAFVHNPDYATGLASSLKAGIGALETAATDADRAPARGALVLLGDMPDVSAETFRRLIEAFEGRPDALAVIPTRQGARGNPVLLSRALFPAVGRLTGDEGARRLLKDVAPIVEVAIGDAGVTIDLDTPEDFTRAR